MQPYSFHPEAEADLNEIWEYIALDSVDAADQVIADIADTLSRISIFPGVGHVRRDLTAKPLRFIGVHSYVVAYAAEEDPVLVLAVFHGRRNPRVIASILRGR